MKFRRNARVSRTQLDAAPFAAVFFLLVIFLMLGSLMLFIIGFIVTAAVGLFQTVPGYMDADYYFMGGLRLAQGHGFNEQILWNYLDAPRGLPHPAFAYWMPLASILAAVALALALSGIAGVVAFCRAIPSAPIASAT